jgi:hypothetical protein
LPFVVLSGLDILPTAEYRIKGLPSLPWACRRKFLARSKWRILNEQ